MGIYRLDLDLLETAKKEYRSAAEKISADIGTSHKAVSNTGADIYKGIDADIFRRDFTGYVNKDFTEAWETVSKIGTTLESGLDHARECKKICNDFPTALGGAGNGRGKEDMRGELYCDQSMISTLKACCTSAMLHAQEVRVLSRVTDMILGELQMVRLDPTQYTDVVRDGCDKVDKLDAHSRELTAYAAAAETMDDSLKSALDVCLPFGWYVKPGCRADEELSPQAEVLVEIMGKQADELSDTDQELLDRNLRILIENNNISELQKVAERIGNGADGTWTVCDVHVAAKILDYGETNCITEIASEIYNKMKKVELIETRTEVHTNATRTTYVYEVGLDGDKVAAILGELDPEENGLAYYSLQRRRKYSGRVKKVQWGICPEEPSADFDITFQSKDEKLVSVFRSDGRTTRLASVDMNEIVGAEGKENLKKLGFKKEESVAMISSIYTDEDIAFMGAFLKAKMKEDYLEVFQNSRKYNDEFQSYIAESCLLLQNCKNRVSHLEEKIRKKTINEIKAFVPQKVDNKVVLTFFDSLSVLFNVPEEIVTQNKINNMAVFKETNDILVEGGYIENQAMWEPVKYGLGNISNMQYSGCGVIATYNALKALGEDVCSQTMIDLISNYERTGAVLSGVLGTAPNAIAEYFDEREYDVVITSSTEGSIINQIGSQSDAIIVTAYNDNKDILQQVHTVCVTKDKEGKYIIHNVYVKDKQGKYVCKDNNGCGYVTLQEAIENISNKKATSIMVIGISNPVMGD